MFVKKSISLKLINRGPNKVQGVGKNQKINKQGGGEFIWHLRVVFDGE